MTKVLIRGGGIAALCCQRLLSASGHSVGIEQADRARLPAIMLSDAALALIRDVFQQPAVFAEQPRITKRVVSWVPGEPAVTLEHSAVLVSEAILLEHLQQPAQGDTESTSPDWTVCSSRPLPAATAELHFGSRIAYAHGVALTLNADPEACWIEALPEGWLFLIPSGEGKGWLLAVGGTAQDLLGKSYLIARQVQALEYSAGKFPAYPRIVDPLTGSNWIACGSAAMAFDPICGDGTANAVREALLASAVVDAAARGENADDVLSHYQMRLIAGFQKHLLLARDFYAAGARGDWWQAELDGLQKGYAWCHQRLAGHVYRYVLDGFTLKRRC